MSALNGLPAIDPTRDTYNFFQGPSTETALIREIADERARSENPNRIRLDNERDELNRRRDYNLFQQLQAEGVNLPRTLTLDAIIEGYLEARQERALFEHLQQRGAFRYPNMDKFFRREPARTDKEIYDRLRVSNLPSVYLPFSPFPLLVFFPPILWKLLTSYYLGAWNFLDDLRYVYF